ncbi:uncharacterized protein EDB91DRAFT_52386 [Suillus paluster]|uniref:uncharacterized protein n=1 Tax=Suillus paluster TaxID=48578 RepID=UPI001B876402|nr:uncharacterized protein EDB91DRAFT_52386 [Suillus paluster]KAG1747971.1 hypothetical protein EDB91DRAFT_52386 [Suillus paluster]
MPAIYTSIPIVCYDIFLVVLAAATLVRHLKEQREIKMKPNPYVVMIVRYHIMYFVLNLINQISVVLLWAHTPTGAMQARRVLHRYRAIYSCTPPHHQYLGYACPRQLFTCQHDVCGLCVLGFDNEVRAARDRLCINLAYWDLEVVVESTPDKHYDGTTAFSHRSIGST